MEDTVEEKKKKPSLSEARADPDQFEQDSERGLAEANLEQAELDKLQRIIAGVGVPERETKNVPLPGDINVLVYVQLTGNEEQLLGNIQNQGLRIKADKDGNVGEMLDDLITLCASVCAEDEIDGLDPEDWFRELHKAIGTEKMFEDILQKMMKPYERYVESVKKFRPDKRHRKKARHSR